MPIVPLSDSEMFNTTYVQPKFSLIKFGGDVRVMTSAPQSLTSDFGITPESDELRAIARLIVNPALLEISVHDIVLSIRGQRNYADWKLRSISNRHSISSYIGTYGDTIKTLVKSESDPSKVMILDVANALAFSFNKDLARKLALGSMMYRHELFSIGLYTDIISMPGRRCAKCSTVFEAPVGVKYNDKIICPGCNSKLIEHYNGVVWMDPEDDK